MKKISHEKNNNEKNESWKTFIMALPTTPIKTTRDQK